MSVRVEERRKVVNVFVSQFQAVKKCDQSKVDN